VPATKPKENRRLDDAANDRSPSLLLLLSGTFDVLGYCGHVKGLLPSLSSLSTGGKLPNGRIGSAIRRLVDGVHRGQMPPNAVLDVPASNGKPPLRLSILPIPSESVSQLFSVLVEPVMAGEVKLNARIRVLEKELAAADQCLRTTIEEYEAATEELRCSYEELRSANEELQATADEFQATTSATTTARDRVELLNRALQGQNTRLLRQVEEFRGVLNSLGFPVIVLTIDLRLRFFNRPAERVFHLTAAHEGTQFRSLEGALKLETLTDTCASVLDQLQPVERVIGGFSFQIRPLLTPEHRIEGVVLFLN
jgi:PAS domain-containing protein